MRILMWNIQSFTEKRIKGKPSPVQKVTDANRASALMTLAYIVSTIQQADPDVFVILEVRTKAGGLGTLAQGNGPNGLLSMLAELRKLSPQWFLVPPLRINPVQDLGTHTETVAVFWRNDRVQFLGPNFWPTAPHGATGPSSTQGGNTGPYPDLWRGAVPQGTVNAARCEFHEGNDQNGEEITFTEPKDRRPYLTKFRELQGQQRVVHLFSVHLRPRGDLSTALTRLMGLLGVLQIPQAGEVVVLAGDFNVNLLDKSAVQTARLSVPLFGLGQITISPASVNVILPISVVRRRGEATAGNYRCPLLLDWGLVCYGAGASPAPPLPRMVVVDRVMEVNPIPPLPTFTHNMQHSLKDILKIPTKPTVTILKAGALRVAGDVTIRTTRAHGLKPGEVVRVAGVAEESFDGDFTIVTAPTPTSFTYAQEMGPDDHSGGGTAQGIQQEFVFRQLENYGHIGPPSQEIGTSDHLPIFFIV